MFDIGFSELLLIAFLALIVLGPKRLPEVARAAGRMAGKLRRFVDSVKRDMDQQQDDAGLKAIREVGREFTEARNELSRVGNDMLSDLNKTVSVDADMASPRLEAIQAGRNEVARTEPENDAAKHLDPSGGPREPGRNA